MRKTLIAALLLALIVSVLPMSINAAELQNYCLNRPVEVSGLENDSNLGEYAVDGDMATRWSSDYVDDAYITVDLGVPLPVGYIAIYWETASAEDFIVEISSDGSSWTTAGEVTGNAQGATNEFTLDVTTSRYIRVTTSKRTTEYGNSIYEIVARKSADAVVEETAAGYPSSGVSIPEGSVVLSNATLIGNETGWGDNAASGRAAAFDGNKDTFFDPLGTGDGFAGIDAGKEYILTKIAILPRDGQLGRFLGGMIQGSNDGEDWVTLFESDEEADAFDWREITDIDNNDGYRYFRYFNETSHGDVAEVELYGYAKDGSTATELAAAKDAAAAAAAEAEAAAAAEEAAPVEEAAAETAPVAAAQTADMLGLAALAAVCAAAAYIASKKSR